MKVTVWPREERMDPRNQRNMGGGEELTWRKVCIKGLWKKSEKRLERSREEQYKEDPQE